MIGFGKEAFGGWNLGVSVSYEDWERTEEGVILKCRLVGGRTGELGWNLGLFALFWMEIFFLHWMSTLGRYLVWFVWRRCIMYCVEVRLAGDGAPGWRRHEMAGLDEISGRMEDT